MSAQPERQLRERLTAYRDSLRSQADQVDAILDRVQATAPPTDVEATRSGMRLFRIVADDLTTLLDGDELKPFVITGRLP